MGGKGSAPPPIDPGASMGEYLFGKDFATQYQGVTDPRLQERIIGAEEQFRPRYAALELQDIGTYARGIEAGEVTDPRYAQAQDRVKELEAQLARTQPTTTTTTISTSSRRGRGPKRTVTKENPEYQRIQEELASQKEYLGTLSPTMMREATPGVFGLLEEQSQRAFELQQEQLQAQRAADVGALQEFAPQVVEAYRAADPYSTEIAEAVSAEAMRGPTDAEQLLGQRGLELAASTGELTPLEQRRAQQSARQASLARGREMGQGALYGEMQARMAEELGKREREIGLGTQLLGQQAGLQQQRFGQMGGAFGMQRQLAGDVGMTILGRPSAAIGLGGQMLGQAQGLAGQPIGPQLFDPNVGINMALQQRGQDIELQGAKAQARGAMIGGLLGAGGSLLGGMASGGTGFFKT